MKRHIAILLAFFVFFVSIAALVYSACEIKTKSHYLNLEKYYPCKEEKVEDGDESGKNGWKFTLEKSEKYGNYHSKPIMRVIYKSENAANLLGDSSNVQSDFTDPDLTEKYVNTLVFRDGYKFNYIRLQTGDKGEITYVVLFNVGDYTIYMCDMDKTTEEMAEYHDMYKNADECIKAIKKFEAVAKKTIKATTDRQHTMWAAFAVSALTIVASGGALLMIFLKRKKTATAVTDNE